MKPMTIQRSARVLKLVLLLFILSIPSKAFAAQISGVWFNENYFDQGINMSLQGTGLKSYFFYRAFAAGFYKGQGDSSDLLENCPKRIEVEYFVNIPGHALNDFTLNIMKNNITKAELEALQEQIWQMSQYFVDLKSGDRFSITYIPHVGTKFEHNGKLVGIIEGRAFAKALFSVWIGKKPFDLHLKEQVLGKTHQ